MIITDVTKEITAYTINVESVTGNFVVGEVVDSSSGGEATVLEWDEENLSFTLVHSEVLHG